MCELTFKVGERVGFNVGERVGFNVGDRVGFKVGYPSAFHPSPFVYHGGLAMNLYESKKMFIS